MNRILIVDDDLTVNRTLARVLGTMGHEIESAFTLGDAFKSIESKVFDVVLLDVRLPDGNGLDMLPRIRSANSRPEVIIMTGFSDTDGAEVAIKNGAWDYLRKPTSIEEIKLQIQQVIEYRNAKRNQGRTVVFRRDGIIGSSAEINTTVELMSQAALSDVNVLITGETGTGKELFARALHDNSSRNTGSFVILDCTSLPETLIESILFGHTKGAFTGADTNSTGLIEQADRGTLFLDEVGELPLPIQKRFLRVLQERQFRPLGAKQYRSSDFRVIAATNRDLDLMVDDGLFRQDLLFRLRSFVLSLPPLRDRAEDIKDIVRHFSVKFCEYHSIEQKGFSSDFFSVLAEYDWPGNVRELIQTVERIHTVGFHDPILFPKHLPFHIRVKIKHSSLNDSDDREYPFDGTNQVFADGFIPLKEYQLKLEHGYLSSLLQQVGNNVSKASEIAGVSRKHLYSLIKKHGIRRDSTR